MSSYVILFGQRSDIELGELCWSHSVNAGNHYSEVLSNRRPVVCGQFEDRDFAVRQVLLVAKILIRSHEEIVFCVS